MYLFSMMSWVIVLIDQAAIDILEEHSSESAEEQELSEHFGKPSKDSPEGSIQQE